MVTSAVRGVLLPDVAVGGGDAPFAQKVVVPIVVFRNHRLFNPLKLDPRRTDRALDVARVRREAARLLLPGQPVEILQKHCFADRPALAFAQLRPWITHFLRQCPPRVPLWLAGSSCSPRACTRWATTCR